MWTRSFLTRQRDYGDYYSLLLIWMVQKDSIEYVLGCNYCMHCSPRPSRHLGKSYPALLMIPLRTNSSRRRSSTGGGTKFKTQTIKSS